MSLNLTVPTGQVRAHFLSYSCCFGLISVYHTKTTEDIVFIELIGSCFTNLLKIHHNDVWQVLRLDKWGHIWNMWLIFPHPKCWVCSSYKKRYQLNSITSFSNVKKLWCLQSNYVIYFNKVINIINNRTLLRASTWSL